MKTHGRDTTEALLLDEEKCARVSQIKANLANICFIVAFFTIKNTNLLSKLLNQKDGLPKNENTVVIYTPPYCSKPV